MAWLSDPKVKKAVSVALAVGSVALLGFVVLRHTVFAEPSLEKLSRIRAAVDSATGEAFPSVEVEDGTAWPWVNPKTGQRTLYPAEFCHWTKDGKAKFEPTYVLLNEIVGKPGKTICPDCGRVVVAHNPLPPNELLIEAAKSEGKIAGGSK